MLVYDKTLNEASVFTDKYGLEPIYIYNSEKELIISTELATFAKCLDKSEIDKQFIKEYCYFNFPMKSTPIKYVKRLSSGLIYHYNFNTNKFSYTEKNEDKLNFEYSVKDLSLMINTKLKKVINNLCLSTNRKISLSLTNGWDARTIQSVMETCKANYDLYTYGVKKSTEIIDAKKLATKKQYKKLKPIYLDDRNDETYFQNMVNSIFLSCGLNNTQRASLDYVYSNLNNYGLILTGIHFGELFRGHSNIPASISRFVAKYLKFSSIEDTTLAQLFNEIDNSEMYSLLKNTLKKKSKIDILEYLINPVGNNLFIGEIKLSRHYTNAVVPVWLDDIIDLAYNSKGTTIEYGGKRSKYKENILQAKIISMNCKSISKTPIHNIIPQFLNKSVAMAYVTRNLISLKNKMNKNKCTVCPAEPNQYWNEKYKDKYKEILLSPDSYLLKYLNKQVIEKVLLEEDTHWVHKFLSLEIILRMINNQWTNFKL